MSDIEYFKNKLPHETIEHKLNNQESWTSSGHTIYGFQNIDFDKFNFSRKKLSGLTFKNCNLRHCLFTATELDKVEFIDCDLSDSRFWIAKITNLNISSCNLDNSSFMESRIQFSRFQSTSMIMTNFEKSKMKDVVFNTVNLTDSKWNESELTSILFTHSILKRARLKQVKFVKPLFRDVNLSETNFSGSTGLLDPISYIYENFEENDFGIIVYKVFGLHHDPNPAWIIKEDSIIIENVNPDRTCNYTCGINVGSKKWLSSSNDYINMNGQKDIWKCFIRNEWFPGIVVPYESYGQIRTARLQLYKKLSQEEIEEIINEDD